MRLTAAAARHATLAARGQATCLALGAYGVALACAVGEGVGLGSPEAHLVALVAATAIGVAWARAASWSAPILVRRADRELGLGGEFVAAVEEEQRDPGGPFARLGAHRLFGRVRPHDLREAAQPHTIGFAAAPLAGIVVVALAASAAADRARETRPPGGALAFLAGEELGRALTKARGEPGLDAELAEALADAAYEARNLGAAAEATRHRGAGATEDLNGTSRAAGDLARTVDQLSRELAGAPETVQAALRRAAAALDTLAFGAAGGAPSPTVDAAGQEEGGEPVDGPPERRPASGDDPAVSEQVASGDGAGGEASSPGAGTVTAPSSGVTMAGSEPAGAEPREATRPPTDADGGAATAAAIVGDTAASPRDPAAAGAPPAAAAIASGRPWPRRYDGLVARWSARDAAPARPPPSPTSEER